MAVRPVSRELRVRASDSSPTDPIAFGRLSTPTMIPVERGQLARVRELVTPDALAAGAIHVVDLTAIRTRLGERWPLKRELVWQYAAKLLKLQLPEADEIVRVDDTHVLIAQPRTAASQAQVNCIRLAYEVIRFFSGAVSPVSVEVSTLLELERDTLVCSSLGLQHVQSILLAHDPTLWGPTKTVQVGVPTRMGRQLTMSLSLEPIWQVDSNARVIGHCATRVLCDEQSGRPLNWADRYQLLPGDLADVDHATLSAALRLRAKYANQLGGLIVPIAYGTLANPSTRFNLLQHIESLSPVERRGFGWEITDLEVGIPEARLAELAAIARQACRGVICQLDCTIGAAEKVKRAGATLSVGPERDLRYTEYDLFKLERVMSAILRHTNAVMFHAVPVELFTILGFIGVTHCTLARSQVAGRPGAVPKPVEL